MKGKLLASVLVIVLVLTLPANVSFSSENGASISIEKSSIYAKKKTKVITINKANQKNANKIHKELMKGKNFYIKVKGNAKTAKKTIKKLNNLIKAENKQGLELKCHRNKAKKAKGYTFYEVYLMDAESYKYLNLFIDKLYSLYKASLLENTETASLIADLTLYPDETELKTRRFYDDGVQRYINAVSGSGKICIGYDAPTTSCTVLPDSDYYMKYHSLNSNLFVKEKNNDTVTLISYEEFKSLPEVVDMVAHMSFFKNKAIVIINNTENFGDLSEAMKVFAIADSEYFDCRKERDGYGMLYSIDKYTNEYMKDSVAKRLYQNTAIGVCFDYANAEYLLWNSLGIEAYRSGNLTLNHEWTVVKVNNSMGKALWIPFDYGIGPAEGLSVSYDVKQQYLATEDMKYSTYLSGIKGAPAYKNFSDDDFN